MMVWKLIWERYFIYQTVKSFLFFLFGFYGLYVLVDYSSHAGTFFHNHIKFQWDDMVSYYASEFIRRMEVLTPFALLLATVRTLCDLSQHNELVALMSSGISLKRLLRPFLLLGLLLTAFLYFNTEYLLPQSLRTIKRIDDSHNRQKLKNNAIAPVQHLILEDKSTLIFQNYDTARKLFFDAYWIRSIDDIYRMQYLFPYEIEPVGHFVDHLVRNQSGELQEKESFSLKNFPQMKFNSETLLETITPPDHLSLSQLMARAPKESSHLSEKEAQVLSSFYYKLAMPWFCFFAVIGTAPWCVRFTRGFPTFLLYGCSIFGLVACYLIMDACLILGERQVASPALAIGIPFGLILFILGGKYISTR